MGLHKTGQQKPRVAPPSKQPPTPALILGCCLALWCLPLGTDVLLADTSSAPVGNEQQEPAHSPPWSAEARLGLYSEQTNYRLPLSDQTWQDSKLDKDALVASIGMIFGPVVQGALALSGSYAYQHEWYTEAQALAEPQAQAGPFSAPSLSADSLERLHDWQLEARYHINERFALGLWQGVKIKNAGSKYLQGSSPNPTKASYRVSDQIVTLPWLRYQWQDDRHESWLVVYLYKEYQHLLAAHSLQTYATGADGKFISLMAAHAWQPSASPKLSLLVGVAALRTRANDLWQEQRRRTLLTTARYHYSEKFIISGVLRLYRDAYLASYLQPGSAGSEAPRLRQRLDHGYSLQLALSYDISKSWRLGFHTELLKNISPRFKDKDFSRNNVMISVSMALPERKPALVPHWLKEGEYLQQRFEINAIK